MKELNIGWGVANWITPAEIRDHILKVKMWTSDYDFEYDLENINITGPSFTLNPYIVHSESIRVVLKKNEGGAKYDILLKDVDSSISSKMRFQFDLFARLDNRIVKSVKCECSFNKTDVARGFEDWVDVETIRDHVLKVKVLLIEPFSDFVLKPTGVETHGSLLFEKTGSNISFLVGDEVVFVLQTILTSRSEYFRAMLKGSFKEAQVPMNVESKIPIQGIEADVFKMIIEWIYTMDIKRLNDSISPNLLLDLQNVYIAADMYLLPDLCDSIGNYLNHLLAARNFAEIHKVAKRIGSVLLEKDVIREWISKADSFNENDDQIKTLIRDFEVVKVDEGVLNDDEEEELSDAAIVGIQRKMIEESCWNGAS
jgi:hypothetical protein